MKIINIHNYDASGVSREAINLPSKSEMEIAGLYNNDGTSMVELWIDGDKRMFDSSQTFVRDRASTRTLEILDNVTTLPPSLDFVTLGPSPAIKTVRHAAHFSRSREGEWTIAVVAKMTDVESGNRALMGRQPGDDTSVNPPSLNFDRHGGSGDIRSVSGTGLTDRYSEYRLKDDVNFTEQHVLIVCSQSEKNGGAMRVNGELKLRDTSEIATRPSTGLDLRLFGSDFGSAAWDGVVGSLILLNKDISDDSRALSVIESHMMEKFGIIS